MVTFATVDPVALIAAFTGPITAIGVIVVAIVNYRTGQKAQQSAEANHNEIKAVHRLVNSGHTQLIKTIAITARQLATSTKRKEHIAEALEAERVYDERLASERAQADADAKALVKSKHV